MGYLFAIGVLIWIGIVVKVAGFVAFFNPLVIGMTIAFILFFGVCMGLLDCL